MPELPERTYHFEGLRITFIGYPQPGILGATIAAHDRRAATTGGENGHNVDCRSSNRNSHSDSPRMVADLGVLQDGEPDESMGGAK